ncbi:MAG: hypothetical protein PHD81_01875 [Candidatus Nanoarchaeia archaeon]|nr:hypothetical protein [Candidatus Nanoarchaeia archaeon]MDD5587837.1 hypothetical protein [Candidatus Nanoarchaeia archaeon]
MVLDVLVDKLSKKAISSIKKGKRFIVIQGLKNTNQLDEVYKTIGRAVDYNLQYFQYHYDRDLIIKDVKEHNQVYIFGDWRKFFTEKNLPKYLPKVPSILLKVKNIKNINNLN